MPPIPDLIRVVFASGPQDLNRELIDRIDDPPIPLYVVGEFEPHKGFWIPYHVLRSHEDNLRAIRAVLGAKRIQLAAMVFSATVPVNKMRALAEAVAPGLVRSYGSDLRAQSWISFRIQGWGRALFSARTRKWLRGDIEIPVRARLAQWRGRRPRAASADSRELASANAVPLREGISVVIPSRDGKDLLQTLFPALIPQINPGEIIVSDNGSTDGTVEWLAANYPSIRVVHSRQALSFARAVNAGIRAAKFHRLLLLNNDMVVGSGFAEALNAPFKSIPQLFCSTAQIFFPEGIRREETGKAVWRTENPLDFPVRCDDPLPGEDLTWVLYGSGGCSLFDTAKLLAIGGVSEVYEPAYVEDMDFGYQAWKRGWPSVFCAAAQVEHRHRATTARFYTPRQLDSFVEINYLRFLIHAVGSAELFRELWSRAIRRLQLLESRDALRQVPKIGPLPAAATGPLSEAEILALGNGDVAIFPGRAAANDSEKDPLVVIASPYLPWPLSHGGAVRMYHMMRESSAVLLVFCDKLKTPPEELLAICREVILVRRHGTHYRKTSGRPDAVDEFDSLGYRACLKQTVQRWEPAIVQLEFTQMAQYADACHPAKTILVEHDITFDLQEQLLAQAPHDWELRQQLPKWKAFESAAWRGVDAVVTMSRKDEEAVRGARRVACLPNGVDTLRFQPPAVEPEARRLLFIGSFAHLPNVLALEFFVNEVWPLLGPGHTLHVIAGAHRERYRVRADLAQPGIEVEGFVSDVRSAYIRAELVLAPLTASAGTNIKVLEAMAMGRAVISTAAGINGLDLSPGKDVIVTASAQEMAEAIRSVDRRRIEPEARKTALLYDWREIAGRQKLLYQALSGER